MTRCAAPVRQWIAEVSAYRRLSWSEMSGESKAANLAMNSASRRWNDNCTRKPGPGLISADLGLFGTFVADAMAPSSARDDPKGTPITGTCRLRFVAQS